MDSLTAHYSPDEERPLRALTIGLVGAPRMTRFACSILAAHTISDFLQLAYHAAEQA